MTAKKQPQAKPDPVEIRFDLSKLTFGDYFKLRNPKDSGLTVDELVNTMNRAAVGGIDAVPLSEYDNLAALLFAAIGEQLGGKTQSAKN